MQELWLEALSAQTKGFELREQSRSAGLGGNDF
jgi:hypothetical protein